MKLRLKAGSSKNHDTKMWQKPFSNSEYILIGAGLTFVGLMLQYFVGPIDWSIISCPSNIVLLAIFIAVIIAMYLLRKKVYLFRCFSEGKMAVIVLAYVLALTLLMGMIKQDGASLSIIPHFSLGFKDMLHSWWYILPFTWLTLCLVMTSLRRTFPFHLRNIPFLLNHWGLFIVLVFGTLGNADRQELTLQAYPLKPEWRALDDNQSIHELPLAIELQQFSIEQYPAKIMAIGNNTGNSLPEKKPNIITVNDKSGKILDWDVKIDKYMEFSAPIETNKSVKYVAWGSSGATESAFITATNRSSNKKICGWVSCGSYLFPFHVLPLDRKSSLVMAEREPKKFSSKVKIYTKDGNIYVGTIEVNKPMDVSGWKIYQLDFDKEKGRWSELSIFKLVKDPWLPVVYIGLIMVLCGAVCLFFHKNENSNNTCGITS